MGRAVFGCRRLLHDASPHATTIAAVVVTVAERTQPLRHTRVTDPVHTFHTEGALFVMHRLGLKGRDRLHMTARFAAFDRNVAPKQLPPSVDYDQLFPMRYDQGNVGACGLYSTAAVYEAVLAKHLRRPVAPVSKRAFYTLTQLNYEPHDVGQDNGVYLGDALATLQSVGHVDASQWPERDYVTSDYFAKPLASLVTQADDIVTFVRVGGYPDLSESALHDAINAGLYAHGPLVYGGMWATDWETPGPDGVLTAHPTQGPTGGHARVYLTYDDRRQARLCLNSWSRDWGLGGLYWEPYDIAPEYLPSDVYAMVVPQT